MPEFDFDTYLGALMPRKLNDTESVVIYALPYYQKLTNLLKGTKKRLVEDFAHKAYLGRSGKKEQEPDFPNLRTILTTTLVIFQGAGQLHPVEIHPPPT